MMRSRLIVLVLSVLAFAVPRAGTQLHAQTKKEGPPEPKIKVGDMAPDFTLIDQNGQKVTLSSFRGKKNVALAFYVFAFTGG